MPKCFFHIRDGNDVWKDEEGVECESMQKMECEAATTAASVLRDHASQFRYGRVAVEVTDEAGRTMLIAETQMQMKRLH
jgi:hypothetical protein